MTVKLKSLLIPIIKLVALLLLSSIIIFAFVSANTTDVIASNYGSKVASSLSSEQLSQLNAYWGRDLPFLERYFSWLSKVLTGDFGISLKYNDSVLNVVLSRSLASFLMIGVAWIISSFVGFILGLACGIKENTAFDRIVTSSTFILASTPTFWIGMLLLFIFAVSLKMFPVGFASSLGANSIGDYFAHAFLPGMTLSIVGISNVAMHTREKTIDVMRSDYIKHERRKGIQGLALIKNHVIKNVSIPAITIQFAQISEIISGSIVIESVFSYPGLGNALVLAATGGDANLLTGITIITTVFVFFGNFIADLIVRRIDPRIE